MTLTIPFPDARRVDPHREIQIRENPAPVVADFGMSMILATERRRKFHETMNGIENFGAVECANIQDRESIILTFMYAATEELKRSRYRLNFDVIQALSYIVHLVVHRLEEREAGVFIVPDAEVLIEEGGIFGEYTILSYVFSSKKNTHPDLIEIKKQIHEGYLEFADYVWKTGGRTTEDLEYMYEEIAHIFPLIIDVLKAYLVPFRAPLKNQLIKEKKDDSGQSTLF